MSKRPLVLVHGYSDAAKAFVEWRNIISGWDRPVRNIYVGSYVSLTNEVTIKDVAEGFDREGLLDDDAFERLHTFPAAFNHPDMNANGISGAKSWY